MKDDILNHNEIRQRVKETRTSRKMTQEDFAEIGQISSRMMSSIETGKKKAGYDFLCKIAEKFYLSLDFLVFGDRFDNLIKKYSELLHLIADCNVAEIRMLCDLVALWKSHLRTNHHERN